MMKYALIIGAGFTAGYLLRNTLATMPVYSFAYATGAGTPTAT